MAVRGGGLFRSFDKQHHYLSDHLRSRFGHLVARQVRLLSVDRLREEDSSIIEEIVEPLRLVPPVIVGLELGAETEGSYRPADRPGYKVSTTRYYLVFHIEGDIESLEHWPDETGMSIRAIDEDSIDAVDAGTSGKYDRAVAIAQHESSLDFQRWRLALRDPDGSALVLVTFLELTLEEGIEVRDGILNFKQLAQVQQSYAQQIVGAVGEQVKQYFSDRLPEEVARLLSIRRTEESIRSAVQASLQFPDSWRQSPVQVEAVEHASTELPVKRSSDGESDSTDLEFAHRLRLPPATYEDVLRTIRVWVDAVERYPNPFRILGEDPLSDLLCATLNAALPGAQREVYSRAGKPDISIRADVLREGLAPSLVFICEAKIWRSRKLVLDAVGQLLGYLEVKDTAAVLLFYLKNKNPLRTRNTIMATLKGAPSFEGFDTEIVAGWPIIRLRDSGRTVRTSICFVDLPEVAART